MLQTKFSPSLIAIGLLHKLSWKSFPSITSDTVTYTTPTDNPRLLHSMNTREDSSSQLDTDPSAASVGSHRTMSLHAHSYTSLKPKPTLMSRARSDFTGSGTSLLTKVPSSSSDASLRPSSQDTRSSEGSQWREIRRDSLARSWLAKSSMLLRRKNNKPDNTLLRTLEWVEDVEDGKSGKHVQELSRRGRSKHDREHSAGYGMKACAAVVVLLLIAQ